MIDPDLSLSFSMQANPGVYALLIGSGASRASGILTGWEILIDLIRKLAYIQQEDAEPDPVAWYVNKYGESPDYAKLLDGLAKTPAERSKLLRDYFEPNEEEIEQGIKIPTQAHRAIAQLIADGYIRVVVTTNFDRLLEKALESHSITPTVISTPDAAQGAIPLMHTECTIIKVHGDYLDTRIKNTPKELETFDKRINNLLDRIFDEFGLIVCGWSAQWDTALRAAIERCKSHRFTTYWTVRVELTEEAKKLITLRNAQVINIQSADSFFQGLSDKARAFKDLGRQHPASAKVAIATVKRYIVDEKYKIQLYDLFAEEAEKLLGELSDDNFPVEGVAFSSEELTSRLQRYEALTETLQAMIITGCYWGGESHEYLWTKCIERISNPIGGMNGLIVWLSLRRYPALLLLYSGGIAALTSSRYSTIKTLLTETFVQEDNETVPAVRALYTVNVMDTDVGHQLTGMDRRYTPTSDYLYSILRQPLKEYLPDDKEYQQYFDRFEYLVALVHADLREKTTHRIWGPIGCFGWRDIHLTSIGQESIISKIELEASTEGNNWGPLKVGLFDGSLQRFQEIKGEFDKIIGELRWR